MPSIEQFVSQLSLAWLGGAILMSAVLIAVCGIRLTAVADQLADRFRIGESLTGGVLLGAVTSISGSVLSVSAAVADQPTLALANAYGGIALQTVFLTIADMSYRRANLEHVAASVENMLQGSLLICLLAILLIAGSTPAWTVWGIHPATLLLLCGYAYGIRLVTRARAQPMWRPAKTRDTLGDEPDPDNEQQSPAYLVGSFLLLGSVLAVTGWALQILASELIRQSGMSAVVVGVLFTSFATSLPELVTTLAAVRRGALTLAFSAIIGGNAYDTLFAAFADVGYRHGSIYHAAGPDLPIWVATGMLMTGILIMGMLVRERRGVANIGFESSLILVVYVAVLTISILH